MKIIAGMATMHCREQIARQAVASILPQIDRIYIVFNDYPDYPAWAVESPKICPVLGHNTFGSNGKFMFSHLYDHAYYLGIDDDLLYPPDYVDYMIAGQRRHRAIVTLHGKRFDNKPIKSYRRDYTVNVRCLGTQKKDIRVHVGGTGVMCFDTSMFNITLEDFAHINMDDVIVSAHAAQLKIPIMALAHDRNYLGYLFPPGNTIWHTSKDDTIPTQIVNNMFDIKKQPHR